MDAKELDLTCGECKDSGTYTLPGSCSNCGTDFVLVISRGHEAPFWGAWAYCPNCGCRRVSGYPRAKTEG